MDLFKETVKEIIKKWVETVDKAGRANGLTPETLTDPLQHVVYEEMIGYGITDDEELHICREIKYKGLVLARLSRKGYAYKMEGFVHPELVGTASGINLPAFDQLESQ
jgi:uncharacterized protein related to proFAR isomerase